MHIDLDYATRRGRDPRPCQRPPMTAWCWTFGLSVGCSALLDVILPVFLVIGFGYAAARARAFRRSARRRRDALRAELRGALPAVPLDRQARPRRPYRPRAAAVSFYAGAFAAFALGILGARLLFRRAAADAVAIGFCCLFSNSLLLGLPIMERAYGPARWRAISRSSRSMRRCSTRFGITVMEIARSRRAGLSRGAVLRRTR